MSQNLIGSADSAKNTKSGFRWLALGPILTQPFLRSILLLAAITFTNAARGQLLAPSTIPSDNTATATFPIDGRPGLIFLPVTVGDTTRFFVFDSGASIHGLDVSYGSDGDLLVGSVEVVTKDAPVSLRLRERPEMSVGPIRITDALPVAVHNFTEVSNAVGRPVHGLIGAPFFWDRMVCIDFVANSVTIGPCDDETKESWDHVYPLHIKKGVFFIDDVSIQGQQLSFMLDTGMAGGIALSREEFDRAMENDFIIPRGDSTTTTVRGNVSRRTGWLREFRLGEFEAETVYVVEAEENKIGLGFLRKRRFRTLIDGKRSRLYLKTDDDHHLLE